MNYADVALVVDLALQVDRRIFDVVILMPSDRDLVPALVETIKVSGVGGPRIEVAARQGIHTSEVERPGPAHLLPLGR